MDCRTTRMLLPYVGRPDELPADETALVQAHLSSCAECRNQSEYDLLFDRTVSRAIKAVEIPATLREQLTVALAVDRGRGLRRRVFQAAGVLTALAALVLLVLSFRLDWWHRTIRLDVAQLAQEEDRNYVLTSNTTLEAAEQYFRANGLITELPRELNYNLLTSLEVAKLQGRTAARLDFQTKNELRLKVYVLSRKDFELTKRIEKEIGSHCEVQIEGTKDFIFVYVIYRPAALDDFKPKGLIG